VETRAELAALAADAAEVTRGLKNVGQADEPDLLQAQVEASGQMIALAQARNDEMRVWREIAAVAGQPDLAPRPLAGAFDDGIPELDKDRALQTILTESPELRLAEVVIERAKAALARAQVEPIPNINFIAGMRNNFERLDSGSIVGPTALAEIAVVIPLFDRNQGNISAARADIIRAQNEVRRTMLALQARFAPVFADYATARAAAHQYRSEILPQTQRAYELYRHRYQQMAAAYPQVLIAQRTMFQAREMYISYVRSAWQSALLLRGLLLTDGLAAPTLHFPIETVPAMQPLRLLPAG
jgi:cobalt-zinc-cadmium efflux system outer membrane protein